MKCTDCGRVLEPQRERGSIRVEVPFKLTVKKTGDSSMTGLWIALLFVSGASLTGTALYSRKKRAKNR